MKMYRIFTAFYVIKSNPHHGNVIFPIFGKVTRFYGIDHVSDPGNVVSQLHKI